MFRLVLASTMVLVFDSSGPLSQVGDAVSAVITAAPGVTAAHGAAACGAGLALAFGPVVRAPRAVDSKNLRRRP